ncbi:MAG: MCE family protein [Epsilonproteobacteria bacterium]|nr:MCE family protein [Campylobacterota bacterium]
MESKNNTFLIGFFVLSLTTALVLFLIWMGRIGTDRNFTEYRTYMRESVAGIQDDSTVRYMGVDVGQITEIKINPKNSEEVELVMKIKNDTPIKTDTKAELKVFGLTGLTFVELSGGTNKAPALKPDKQGKRIIQSKKSQIALITDSIATLSEKSSVALDGLNKILNDKNAKNIEKTLDNLAQATSEMKELRVELSALIEKTSKTEDKISASTVDTMHKVGNASVALKDSAKKFDVVIRKTEKLIDSSNSAMNRVNSETLSKTNALLDEMRTTVATYDKLGKQLEEKPNSIIWGK